MLNPTTALTLLSLAVGTVSAITRGVDLYSTTADFSCIKNAGYDFAIQRSWHSFGGMDTAAVPNIKKAREAGIKYVDVYMFPCRAKSASDQVASMIKNLETADYGMVWLDIETNPSTGCGWDQYTSANNC